ncbi:MAG: radical SAM protein [Paludibacteraceae bacterium]|nr:radical SAM protein [Paludibacteraceae bacterium]
MIQSHCKYPLVTRYVNALKVLASYVLSTTTEKSYTLGLPVSASVEPANFCNLNCTQCPTGLGLIKKRPTTMDLDKFKSVIDALSPELMWLNLYFQGEPFLNKHLPEMVKYANAHHIKTSISTNGHFLSKETATALKNAGLDHLIISLDGATEESYVKYRQGGNFNKVIEGIENAVQAGLNVELQCLLLSSTENETVQVKQLGKRLGVGKITFKTAQFYTKDSLMPQNNAYSRYRKGSLTLKKKLHNRCWRIISGVVITTDGEVLPCCFDKDCTYSYGNIFKAEINKDALCKILTSQKASDFKNKVFSNRKSIEICTNCTE